MRSIQWYFSLPLILSELNEHLLRQERFISPPRTLRRDFSSVQFNGVASNRPVFCKWCLVCTGSRVSSEENGTRRPKREQHDASTEGRASKNQIQRIGSSCCAKVVRFIAKQAGSWKLHASSSRNPNGS